MSSPTDERAGAGDLRRFAPSASRNAAPIVEALGPVLAGRAGTALEIGSGTGQHSAALAAAFPSLDWQPTEFDPANLESIEAWRHHSGCPNLRAPMLLDALSDWPVAGPLAAVMAVNVIHISPWPVAEAIVAGAARRLESGGKLVFYGPFRENGRHTADSNAAFDASLRARDPAWGVRDRSDMETLASAAGLGAGVLIPMPANNRILVFTQP